MRTMRQWNFVVAVAFAALGVTAILLAREFPIRMGTGDPGSGFWPTVLGGMAVALSVLLAVVSCFGTSERLDRDLRLESGAGAMVFSLIGFAVAFLLLLYVAGILVALFLFVYATMTMIGGSSRKERLLTAFIIVAAIHVVFGMVLKTPLPEPIFWR